MNGADRQRQWPAWLLVGPLVLFLVVNFLAPISLMLLRGVQDSELSAAWPETTVLLRAWDGRGLPDEKMVETLLRELPGSHANGTLGAVAARLNSEIVGFRSLLFSTARDLAGGVRPLDLHSLKAIDERWGRPETWMAMQRASGPFTGFHLLSALDLQQDASGALSAVPKEQSLFVDVFLRTFSISAIVALSCLALGYPVAFLLAHAPTRVAAVLLVLVLLPFWTSVLVRTTAWVVLLQRNGLVNDALLSTTLISTPLELIYNRTGVLIAMTHVLLPYLILPLYGVMRTIPANTMRAALSLGASPLRAFVKIYLPQTLPGIAAGCLIVFILSLGYYITPALLGGAGDQMIAHFVAFYTTQTLNWGMAAALSLLLLLSTLALYAVYARCVGANRVVWR